MSKLRLLVRQFKRRFLGTRYCAIETVSTHRFKVVGRLDGYGLMCRCVKCGLRTLYDPIVGGHQQ